MPQTSDISDDDFDEDDIDEGRLHDERLDPAPEEAEPRRRTLDEAVLSVLREEAEREANARRAEGSSLEIQDEMGLTQPDSPTPPDSDPPDAMEERDAVINRATKRDLLPDIEEINSTLRPSAERAEHAATRTSPQALRTRRNDFRSGFISSLLVASFLLAVYLASAPLAARLPVLAPALTSYSRAVDDLRQLIDRRMRSTTESLTAAESG